MTMRPHNLDQWAKSYVSAAEFLYIQGARRGRKVEAMTREQIDATEKALEYTIKRRDPSHIEVPVEDLRRYLAVARKALELEETLEYAAGDAVSLYKAGDGRFCCVMFDGSADLENCFYGATPLEAINNARGNHGG